MLHVTVYSGVVQKMNQIKYGQLTGFFEMIWWLNVLTA